MKVEFDLVIVGGGFVGLTLAAIIGKNTNLSIAIIEPKQPKLAWNKDSFDNRCFAINHASRDILQSLGVWSDILQHNIGYYQQMQVWDESGYGRINFSASEINTDNLGYIIENRILTAVLWQSVDNMPNITIIPAEYLSHNNVTNTKNISVAIKHISTKINYNLYSNLLVAADGANSLVRKNTNIKLDIHDYQQSALVATIETKLEHNNTARQRFLPDGPLAFLPLANKQHCSIVWTSTTDNIKTLLAIDAKQFCNKLTANFLVHLGKLRLLSPRLSYPLKMLHAKRYFTDHVVLVGDAAHVVHPLAGQGVNLGLLDAKILAEEISLAVSNGQDFSTNTVLRNYEKKRQGHNLTMLKSMNLFNQIFSSQYKALWALRNSGLNLIDHLPSIKKFFIMQALGNYKPT